MPVRVRLWSDRTIHIPSGPLAHLLLSAAFALIGAFPASGAASLRCPSAVIGPLSTAQESAEITSLWNDLALPAASGSDGPLGCPVDQLVQTDAVSGWSGIIQRFQRGFVLIGRGSSTGFEVAAVRGIGGWFVWWNAPPSMNLGDQLMPVGPDQDDKPELLTPLAPGDPLTPGGVPAAQNATWSHGGFVRETAVSASTLSLWRCKVSTCVHPIAISPASWGPVTLKVNDLDSWNRPFDAAAKLDAAGLSRPDVTGFAGRVRAVFQDWLPCYTRSPASDASATEDTIERAMMMMRGTTPCILTGAVPRSAVESWLTTFTFPKDHLPGTDITDWPCRRPGDLDFLIIELLHLINEHQGQLSPGSLTNARSILSPWGGAARTDPYITPSGTCLGFNVIETENHLLMQETARYLINSLSGADRVSNRDWILRFLQQLARRDFYEYNSIPYMRFDLKALYVLRDYAPDPTVNMAAEGIIDWLFAKQALSANFDRDHRPYRRRPEAQHYAGLAWWGDATIVSIAQAALLAGPLQHVHEDFDLELNDELDNPGTQGIMGRTQVAAYPSLGAAGEMFLAEFTDVADTQYKLPAALQGWFQDRYSDDSNRLTYIQGLHHSSPVADDASLFLQPNHGVELMSGNRNWTIIAGGNAVAPGFPPTPPGGGAWIVGGVIAGAIVGAIVGVLVVGPFGLLAAIIGAILGGVSAADISKAIAAKKQLDGLWSDQPGIMRETTLIPTPVGLDRSQTIRFSQPLVTNQGANPFSRLCVAEGFLCGFDLVMPNRPFPVADVAPCPLDVSLPAQLAAYRSRTDVNGQPVSSELGCLIKMPNGDVRDWSIWTFEYGVLAIGVGDPPGRERIAALWLQDDLKGQRIVRLQWRLPGQPHNWYNVHAYNTAVTTSAGDAPAGAIQLQTSGDPNNSSTYYEAGDVSFSLEKVNDSSWSLIAEGCLPSYGFLHIRTGHSCRSNILPKLPLNVALRPKQSFSCRAHQSVIKDSSSPSFSPGQGLVLEVGSSCSSSPYGFFVYVRDPPCTGPYVAPSLTGVGSGCPAEANDYGFVIVAPSRGWTWQDFSNRVEVSIASWTAANGRSFQPTDSPSIDIPISPPVSSTMMSDGKLKWTATGPPTSHRVTFRWMGATPAQGNILADSGAPGVFGPLTLDPEKWPTALGNISAPDVPAGGGRLIHSGGSGCFTVAGIPTPSHPDPVGLLVDLRNASAPVVKELLSSALPGTCP